MHGRRSGSAALVLGSAFALACSSSSKNDTRPPSDAGAAGAEEAGAPSSAGSGNAAREDAHREISCDFGGEITLSKNENDYYFIEVYADGCGYAPSPPPFLAVQTLPN